MADVRNGSIESAWESIESVRVSCNDYLAERGMDRDIIDAVSMSLTELLENAVKFSEPAKNSVEYSITINSKLIMIEVKNTLTRNQDYHLDRLEKTVQWLRGFHNSFEAFYERLREVSMIAMDNHSDSGLGLARIAYEGRCIVDFYVNSDSVIAVSAVYQL